MAGKREMNMSCTFFGGFSLWILLICQPTAYGLGAICMARSGLEQCGVPPLSPAQIVSIDRGRVDDIRSVIQNRTSRRPIIENDPDVDPDLIQPVINFTDAQLDAVRSLYRNNMQPPATNDTTTVNFRTRRQANTRSEACVGNTIARILFAVTPNNEVVQVEGAFPTSVGCSRSLGGQNACQSNHCCEEEMAVPIFIYNIDTLNWGRDDIIVTRCTCCEPTPT